MDNNPQTTAECKDKTAEERQNRRQFLNGLGRWSLAVIAAVAALRDGLHDLRGGIGSRFETGPERAGESGPQIAKKKRPHGDQPHLDDSHMNVKTEHQDYYRLKRQQDQTSPGAPGGAPGGTPDKTQ